MCRQHQDALVRKLVRETYEQLLLSTDQSLQAAAFKIFLDGCSQLLYNQLSPAEDQPADGVTTAAQESTERSNQHTFQDDAQLIQSVVKSRPEAFAAMAFNQLAQVTLQTGKLPSCCMQTA